MEKSIVITVDVYKQFNGWRNSPSIKAVIEVPGSAWGTLLAASARTRLSVLFGVPPHHLTLVEGSMDSGRCRMRIYGKSPLHDQWGEENSVCSTLPSLKSK